MPSWSLVTSIVLALIIFSVIKMTVVGIWEFIIDWMRDSERIKAEKFEQEVQVEKYSKQELARERILNAAK